MTTQPPAAKTHTRSTLSGLMRKISTRMQGLNYLHRGIVLGIDILCSELAAIISYLGTMYAAREPLALIDLLPALCLALALSTAVFFFFRFYRIIIRHASLRSLPRIIGAVLTSVLLQGAGLLAFGGAAEPVCIYTLLNFLVACAFIIGVRCLMIFTYYLVLRVAGLGAAHAPRKKLFIYGPTSATVNLARLLDSGYGRRYQAAALIDPESEVRNMFAADLRLYGRADEQKLKEDIENNVPDAILFTDRKLLRAAEETVVSWCSDAGVSVLLASAPEEYDADAPLSINPIRIEDLLERDEITIDEQDIARMVEGRCVLVTGAAGSIGSEIVRQLCKFRPACIGMLDCAETPLHLIRLEIEETHPDINIRPIIANLRDRERIAAVMAELRPAVILHAAAYKHVPLMEEHPCEAVLNNVVGTRRLADLAVEYGTEKFVMISTDKAVNPTSVMGATKRCCCLYVQALNIVQNTTRFITTRFGNVLGSNGSVIPRFTQQIEAGGPVTVTHPDIVRYFMTIPEACRLVLQAAAMGEGGEIFAFDMGAPVRIDHLARRMIRLAGLEPGRDIEIAYTGLRPGEKLYEEVLDTAEDTTATRHHKIRIANARKADYATISDGEQQLIAAARSGDAMETVRRLKQLIPEYKSKNSVYEQLDAEV